MNGGHSGKGKTTNLQTKKRDRNRRWRTDHIKRGRSEGTFQGYSCLHREAEKEKTTQDRGEKKGTEILRYQVEEEGSCTAEANPGRLLIPAKLSIINRAKKQRKGHIPKKLDLIVKKCRPKVS